LNFRLVNDATTNTDVATNGMRRALWMGSRQNLDEDGPSLFECSIPDLSQNNRIANKPRGL
jgi:hypothetical protein